jgi:hypothetical protein
VVRRQAPWMRAGMVEQVSLLWRELDIAHHGYGPTAKDGSRTQRPLDLHDIRNEDAGRAAAPTIAPTVSRAKPMPED